MSKIYVIEQISKTFGQTEAGCHVAVSEKKVVGVFDTDAGAHPSTAAANEAAAKFVQRWGAYLMVRAEGGDYPYTLRVPIAPSLRGLEAVCDLIAARDLAGRRPMPYVETSTPGQTRFALRRPETDEPAEVHLDKANLAYQRALLK